MPNESEIIGTITEIVGGERTGYSPLGDDVGVAPTKGRKLIVKVDMLVETTDVPTGMTYRQAARKVVAMCVSDFAAKGVRPDSFLISMGLKRGITGAQVRELGLGLRDAKEEWQVGLVGGDTNEAGELVIDCAMFGFAGRIVGRKGAKHGDVLVVTRRFGLERSGLMVLNGTARAERRFGERAKRSVLYPSPDLQVGLALGNYLSSAMDSSDGLARSIHTLAKESGVGFRLSKLPAASGVAKFARANGADFEKLVFEGGEEYSIVGTIRKEKVQAASRAVRHVGGELLVIGEATSEVGSIVFETQRGAKPVRDIGWTHLG